MKAIEYSNQLIWAFPPPLGDGLMGLREGKDRMIPPHSYFFSFQKSLNRQKAYLELHPCDPSCKIGRDTQKHMGHDILYPSHSYLLESMTLLEDTIESFNDRPFLVETQEGFAVTDRPHSVLDLVVFLEIEDRSVSSLPADGTKETLFGFLFEEAAAEFESLSFGFSSPVGQLKSCFTGIFPLRGYNDISPLDWVFSTPWVFCDDRGNLVLNQVACIFRGIVSCICNYSIDLFIYGLEAFLRFFGKLFEKLSIPLICRGYLNSERDRQFGIGDLEMDLVTEEAKVFAFVAPGGIGIGFFGFDVRGIDREAEIFLLNEAEGLSDEIHDDFGEGFLTEPFSEVVEGVMVGGFSVREATEVGESSIVSEFSGEVSFGGGVAQVDQKEGFEEGDRVITLSSLIGGFIFSKFIDEREVDLLV